MKKIMFSIILISLLLFSLASANEKIGTESDNTINIQLDKESDYLAEFNDINIKFNSIIPVSCIQAPCSNLAEITITKKNVLNKKANRYTLGEDKRINIYGVEIILLSFNEDSASFQLFLSKDRITPKEDEKIIVGVEYGPDKIQDVKVELVGEKKVISVSGATKRDCEEYKKECYSGNEILCNKYAVNCEKDEIKVETKEEVKIENNKIYINEKEIKIMPNTVSEKAIEGLQVKKEISIWLKDIGKPIYEVEGVKKGKIFGIISTEIKIKSEIDAETGDIISVKKPWWAFFVKK